MIRSLNPAISDETREAMIEYFTEMCTYHENIAMSSLCVTTLTSQELIDCVRDADDDVAERFSFRMRDIWV